MAANGALWRNRRNHDRGRVVSLAIAPAAAAFRSPAGRWRAAPQGRVTVLLIDVSCRSATGGRQHQPLLRATMRRIQPFAHSMRGCTGTDVCTDMIALLLRSMAGVLRRRNSTIRGEGVNGTHATGLVWASVVTSTAESRRGLGTARPLALLSALLPPSRLPLWSRGGAG